MNRQKKVKGIQFESILTKFTSKKFKKLLLQNASSKNDLIRSIYIYIYIRYASFKWVIAARFVANYGIV